MRKNIVAAIFLTLILCSWPMHAVGRYLPREIKVGNVCTIGIGERIQVTGKIIKIDQKSGWLTLEKEKSKETVYIKMEWISLVRID